MVYAIKLDNGICMFIPHAHTSSNYIFQSNIYKTENDYYLANNIFCLPSSSVTTDEP